MNCPKQDCPLRARYEAEKATLDARPVRGGGRIEWSEHCSRCGELGAFELAYEAKGQRRLSYV